MKYRKKPVIVEAVHYAGETVVMPKWIQQAFKNGTLFYDEDDLYVETLEGTHHVSVGDYIIQGVKGELYPCKPDIFDKTYEKAVEQGKTHFEYLKNCTMDEMVQAIYDCTMANSWSFNKDGIKRWLKQPHHESVTNCNE
jgi:hypothetical protein